MAVSSGRLRYGVWAAGVATVLVGGGAIAVSAWQTGFEADRMRLEAIALSQGAKTVEGKDVPRSWSAGTYISADGINQVLQGLRGVKVAFDPATANGEDAELEVLALNMGFSPGFASGTISLSLASRKRDLSLELEGEATLIFRGVVKRPNQAGEEEPFAQFAVRLIKVEPDISWSGLRARFTGYASDLIKTGLTASLAENLNVEVPIKDSVGFDLKMERDITLPVRDPKTENYVVVHLSAPPQTIERGLSYDPPIFTEGGLWLLANAVDPGQQASPPLASDTDPVPSPEQTEANRKVLAAIAAPEGDPDVFLWLRSQVIVDLINQIQSLPEGNRTITARSVDFRGRLSDDGTTFVELTGKDAVSGTATISSLSSAWTDERGFVVSGQLRANTKSDVHVHFDPGIGGGVGSSIGLLGQADIAIRAGITAGVTSVDDHRLLLIHPEVECQPAVISMKSDGKLKVPGIFVADVPSIGGIMKGPLGAQTIPPMLALSDLPFVVSGAPPEGGPIAIENDGKRFLIDVPWHYAEIAVEPVSSHLGADGLFVSAKMKVDLVQEISDTSRAQTQAALLAKAIGSNQSIKPCAGEPSFAVTLGPFEFGPNSVVAQVLKAFQDAGKTAEKTVQDVGKAAEKAAHDVGKTAEKAAQDTGKAIEKGLQDAGKFFGFR
ncbi:hypothetical protein [Ensifer aridi]|uniref:hypothetical protein n=1 Tax=Ensifer aridi TaxID=1708715 RepID=UPI000A11BB43|nr:hypothetical protein [Ensifer aridi]